MHEKSFNIVVCYNDNEKFQNLEKCLSEQHTTIYSIFNHTNQYSIPQAYNQLTRSIPNGYIIYIHQDVELPPIWLDLLAKQIRIIECMDPFWGVAGIMGVKANGFFAGNILDPHTNKRFGKLPCKVSTLDEVCLITKMDKKFRFDEELGGYHFYGADLCLQARQRGLSCYAIDTPLQHLSGGTLGASFWDMAQKFLKKWEKQPRAGNTIETTCGVFKLRNTSYSSLEYTYKIMRRKILRRLQRRTIRQ